MSEAPPANQPLVLAETHLTEIGGNPADVPVKAVLHLVPQPWVRLEVPDLPAPHFATANTGDPFSVLLETGETLQVLMAGWGLTAGPDATVYPATLAPYEQPCVVMDNGEPLMSTTADILNFSQFYGSMDYFAENGERVGSAVLEAGEWEITLTSFHNLRDQFKTLSAEGGYAFTHTCSIKRADGGSYGSHDVDELLDGLRWFLSFARGAFCGVANVEGRTNDDSASLIRWGTRSTSGWQPRRSWLPKPESTDRSLTGRDAGLAESSAACRRSPGGAGGGPERGAVAQRGSAALRARARGCARRARGVRGHAGASLGAGLAL